MTSQEDKITCRLVKQVCTLNKIVDYLKQKVETMDIDLYNARQKIRGLEEKQHMDGNQRKGTNA